MPLPPPSQEPTPTGAGLPEPALAAQAFSQLLRPMARLMIDHGVQLADMLELLKSALVEEAKDAYALTEKGSSDTRIALLTGVPSRSMIASICRAEWPFLESVFTFALTSSDFFGLAIRFPFNGAGF